MTPLKCMIFWFIKGRTRIENLPCVISPTRIKLNNQKQTNRPVQRGENESYKYQNYPVNLPDIMNQEKRKQTQTLSTGSERGE